MSKRRNTHKKHYSRKKRHTRKKQYSQKKQNSYKRRHNYRKKRNINLIPGTQSIPIFSKPKKIHTQSIVVNKPEPSGNIIIGMRDYFKG